MVGAENQLKLAAIGHPALRACVPMSSGASAELYVSADAPDADVFVKLVDVYPDGTAYNLAETALRLRYREGAGIPASLVPGQVCGWRCA